MITKREFDTLVLLTETKEVVSQKDMAERLKISAEAVNKTVKELTEKNYCKNGQITQAGLDALEPYRVKRAVFVAAGFGSRMVPITLNTPKPLVRVNGTRIIDSLLDAVVEAGLLLCVDIWENSLISFFINIRTSGLLRIRFIVRQIIFPPLYVSDICCRMRMFWKQIYCSVIKN